MVFSRPSRSAGWAMALTAILIAPFALAADSSYIQFDGADAPEPTTRPDWSGVLEWSWGAKTPFNPQTGQVTGGPQYEFVHVKKNVDSTSTFIRERWAGPQLIDEVTIAVQEGGATNDRLKLRLTDVLVVNYHISHQSGGTAVESIDLKFAGMEIEYATSVPASGPPAQQYSSTWDTTWNGQ